MVKQKKDTALTKAPKFINQSKVLRKFRESNVYTQRELGEKINVNTQYISNMERGVAGISVKTARALTKLGLDKNQLILSYKKDLGAAYEQSICGK